MKHFFASLWLLLLLTACEANKMQTSDPIAAMQTPSLPHAVKTPRMTATIESTNQPVVLSTPLAISTVPTIAKFNISGYIWMFKEQSETFYSLDPESGGIEKFSLPVSVCQSPLWIEGTNLLVCRGSKQVVDLAGGKVEELNGILPDAVLLGYASNGRFVYYLKYSNPEQMKIIRYDLENQNLEQVGTVSDAIAGQLNSQMATGFWYIPPQPAFYQAVGVAGWSSFDGTQIFWGLTDLIHSETEPFGLEGYGDQACPDLAAGLPVGCEGYDAFYPFSLFPSPVDDRYLFGQMKSDVNNTALVQACEPIGFREQNSQNALLIGNLTSPRQVRVLEEFRDRTFYVKGWSPDAKWVAIEMVCDPNGKTYNPCVVNVKSGGKICWQGWDAEHKPLAYAWSPDSHYLAVLDEQGTLSILDLQDGSKKEISVGKQADTLFWR